MSAPGFGDLFAWEWRRAGRSRLMWALLAILAASFVYGATNTAAFHRAQDAAIGRALAADAAFVRDTARLATRFREPVRPGAGEVAYWQDPTNVAGHSEYFVRRTATKSHLPLSPLAVGVSDLAPGRLEIKLNTLFGFADSYDFENPRGLALGWFDLSFALVFLLPIGLLLALILTGTFERDRGMLRLVVAQATGPRAWIGARVVAVLAWMVPAILLSIVCALMLAGVSIGAAPATLAAALALVAACMLFWSGIALLILAHQPGAAGALGIAVATWAGLTLGAPLAVSAGMALLDPAPSPLAYIDRQRQVADAVQAERDALVTRALLARPELAAGAARVATLDHATRLSFLVPESERRLAPARATHMAHRARQQRLAAVAGLLLPPVGMERALATLAGTDAARQLRFEQAARAFQLELRAQLHPAVQREIVAPQPSGPRATRGRLNLPRQPVLPAFRLAEPGGRIGGVMPYLLWLGVLTIVVTALGLVRTRGWRVR